MNDPAKIQAFGDVLKAADRLTEQGLASTDPRGLNADGLRTLADLLAVATFQFGTGNTPAEKVASGSMRASMGALSDIISQLQGEPTSGDATRKLLREAMREARRYER